jgi:tRNA-specific 2-thiouridylase
MTKVMAAMSGGVDSSVVAALLKEQGFDTCGGTLRLYEQKGISKEVKDAQSVCNQLNINHFVYAGSGCCTCFMFGR